MPVALVTGSAGGIGRQILLDLAATGHDVVVHYLSSEQAAEQTVQEALELAHKGGQQIRSLALPADLRQESEANGLVEEVQHQLGSLDILVNNVGNYHFGPISELDSATWQEMLDTNLNCTFYLCQKAIPKMREKGWGRIVNIGYAGAEYLRARPSIVAYNIAKTGVILYSKALAKSYAADGITVNVVSPGVMENSVTKPLDAIPFGREGKLAELSDAVLFLVSEKAAYLTGSTLEVAGGWNL